MSDPSIFRRPLLDRRAVLTLAGASLVAAASGGVASAQDAEPPLDARLVLETVTFQLRKQVFKGQLVRTRTGGKRPGLLLIPDQRGPTPYFRALSRRFALDGFTVLLPDLLTPHNVPENSEEAENILTRISPAETMLALDMAADLLIKHPDCNGAIGALGFAWGGAFALQFAMNGGRIKAAVSYYALPPSADRIVDIKVPVLFHWSENDPRTAPMVDTIERRLIGAGKIFEEYVYPDTQSGFASDPTGRRWNRTASDHAYDRSAFFLKRWLTT